ncbi:MAG TPA: CRTAC1 family protein [Candidatus Dormibacteraeota bacterium]|nr:CRTAC1 family protein [Candidatus Dormibacteraeota bacterium]
MRPFRPGFTAVGLVLVAACSRGPLAPTAAKHGDGVRRMADRLNTIARTTQPKDYPWRNSERAEDLHPMIETTLAPRDYLELMPRYATELLNAGKTREAIQALMDLKRFSTAGGTNELSPKNSTFLRHHLAIAYLRLGEQENCQLHHNTESCLMPIMGGGIHARPEGSREAMAVLLEEMKQNPDDQSARWWMNIAAMTLGEYPDGVPKQWLIPPKAFDSDYDIKRFHDIAPGLGLDMDDYAGGSIAEDFDGDGYLDIMASSTGLHGQLRYFHNNADGTFSDRTVEAGLVGEVQSLNIVQTDYDNDGRPDVLMLRGGWLGKAGHLPNSLLHNNGDGTFDDVTEEAGMLSLHPTQTAAWFDYDNDGWLDVVIGNESTKDDPNRSELYHNNRDGTFTECAALSGLTIDCMVKGVTAGDYNNDGRPDLYASCRKEPNRLYRNDGPKPGGRGPTEWTFTEVAAAAGVTEPVYSFPTWFFDYDNDGWLDLFVAGYNIDNVKDFTADYMGLPHTAERARLYHNEHDGTFKDMTRDAHLYKILHAMGSNYGDLDNDGWLDFYVGTGDPNLGTLIPNRMFRNAEGRFFQEVTTSGGFGHLQKGHGVSFADFDDDGDQDIYEVMGGVYEADHFRNVLYENPGHGNHFVKLKLVGVKTNRAAIGCRIRIVVDTPGGPREIHRSVTSGGSFGGNPLRQEIGLGDARSIAEIRVTWPTSGIVQTFKDVTPDRAFTITEGDQNLAEIPLKTFRFATRPVPAGAAGK